MVQSFLIFVSTQIFHPILKRLDIGTVPCVAPVVTEFFAWSDSSGDKCMIILFKNFFHGIDHFETYKNFSVAVALRRVSESRDSLALGSVGIRVAASRKSGNHSERFCHSFIGYLTVVEMRSFVESYGACLNDSVTVDHHRLESKRCLEAVGSLIHKIH